MRKYCDFARTLQGHFTVPKEYVGNAKENEKVL
jgi:hypothetical protein